MTTLMNVVDTIDAKIDRKLPQSPEAIKKRRQRIIIPTAIIALSAAGFFGGKAIIDANSSPTFSDATTSYTFESNDGPLAAAEQIKGLSDDREGVSYIESLPENKAVFAHGIQPGETVTIPVSASK